MSKTNEESVDVWLADAKTVASPGTRAEKACLLIEELLTFVKEVAACSSCHECCIKSEYVLEKANEIVEEI